MLIALFKPFGVLSQFTPDHPGQQTLAEFGLPTRVYPIGRLDRDSEGLLLLSDEPEWTHRLLDPRRAHPREYHIQVEGIISNQALDSLESGVVIHGRKTLPARAKRLEPPPPWPARQPPIRFRKSIPDSWLSLELIEGRNRQARRMTAAVGFPTLRLIRVRIGNFTLAQAGLDPGQWRTLTDDESTLLKA